MDYVLPNELVDGMIAAGGKKSTVSVKNLLIRGFYSGAILGLAVILALTVGITVKAPYVGPPIWDAVAQKIMALNQINVEKKYEALGSMGFFLAFLRGLVANWLVCLGVTMALVSKSVPGKILACWLPITAFQSMGMEHIVVNQFLHTAGPILGSGVPFTKVIFWNFLPVTLGNIVGGMVFIGMLFYSTHRTPMENVLPTEHDEKLERELAAELGAR